MEQAFNVTIKDGKLIFNNPEHWEQYIKNLKGTYILTLESSRTEQQNKLYWTYIRIISDTTGEEPERLHMIFRDKFINGESTTRLSPKTFNWFLENIKVMMSEYNIILPDPSVDPSKAD